jgi:hypothetical protein
VHELAFLLSLTGNDSFSYSICKISLKKDIFAQPYSFKALLGSQQHGEKMG